MGLNLWQTITQIESRFDEQQQQQQQQGHQSTSQLHSEQLAASADSSPRNFPATITIESPEIFQLTNNLSHPMSQARESLRSLALCNTNHIDKIARLTNFSSPRGESAMESVSDKTASKVYTFIKSRTPIDQSTMTKTDSKRSTSSLLM